MFESEFEGSEEPREWSPDMNDNRSPSHDEEEEEEECRVCRGPAEDGRPLYKPCRCRGSIGLTHQDCLQSWLEIRQRSGTSASCELCKTEFQFVPLYKEDAPERLPLFRFISGIFEIFVVSWVPAALKCAFALIMWLVVAPLLTAYLYQSWMVGPSASFTRFSSRKLIWADVITGLVIAGIVVVSLLSFMSLVDLLRLEWNRPPLNRMQQELEEALPQSIDDGIWTHAQNTLNEEQSAHAHNAGDDESWDELDEEYEDLDDDDASRDEIDENQHREADDPLRQNPDIPPEDVGDVDINIAVDEMLGLRGPWHVVLRNILWVLAFNAIYLGFFAFVPRSVGYTFCSFAFNMTDPRGIISETNYTGSENFTDTSFSSIWSTIQNESIKDQTIFRVGDVITITVGYLFIAFCTGLMQVFMTMWSKVRGLWGNQQEAAHVVGNNIPEVADVLFRPGVDEGHDGVAAVALDFAVKTTLSIVKVGFLLFLKMFILPIALGFALCTATWNLIGVSVEEQVRFAGRDVFTFVLLHWVAGITFMLMVTVSVLQLREVLHPDICSRVIRPQEPHPDLLGNLMKESLATHVRRMSMSFLVYSALLWLFIHVPTRALASTLLRNGLRDVLKLKFAYFLSSKLQAPIELLTFHLLMLTILEKYKNTIGALQHRWLRSAAGLLGLSQSLLPYDVGSFQHVGTRQVFTDSGEVDPFWYDLATSSGSNKLIEENKSSFTNENNSSIILSARAKTNGEKVLPASADCIRLPNLMSNRMLRRKDSVLLKTKIGRYRLRREIGKSFNIQLWEEVRDQPIARPPEGWDDLGAGGAHAQGRWAWGKEKKSVVEHSVADRDIFFQADMSKNDRFIVYSKLAAIVLLSWLSLVTIIVASFVAPLLTGRLLFTLLHVPESWVHDPFAWFLGCIFFRRAARSVVVNLERFRRNGAVLFARSIPPARKLQTVLVAISLHVALAPFQVGAIYNAVFVEKKTWFDGLNSYPFPSEPLRSWFLGLLLIELWTMTMIYGLFTPFNDQVTAQHDFDAWQGEAGRVRRFWNTLGNAICYADWEDVDPTTLLHDFAFPLFVELSTFQGVAIVVPLALRLSGLAIIVDAASFTRLALGISLVFRACLAWKVEISRCVEALHRLARDRQYLIGEVLINYGTDVQ